MNEDTSIPPERRDILLRRSPLRRVNPEKQREWKLEKTWVLACLRRWQIWERIGTERAYCCLCDQFHGWDWMTADHIHERAKRPNLIHEPMNMQPVGLDCNGKKNEAKNKGKKEYEKWAGDRRPERLRMLIAEFRSRDWDLSGRRPKIGPKADWWVTK